MKNRIVKWLFKDQLSSLNKVISESKSELIKIDNIKKDLLVKTAKVERLLGNIDVSVDVDQYSGSWAVISIQGKSDYVKFVSLRDSDARDISRFVERYDRKNVKIDAPRGFDRFYRC